MPFILCMVALRCWPGLILHPSHPHPLTCPLCDTLSFVGFLVGPWTVTHSSLRRVCWVIVVCLWGRCMLLRLNVCGAQ